METTKQLVKGGEFLIKETEASHVFIPEEWTEEQQLIAQTCRDFLKQEILPRLDEIDSQKDPKLVPSLLDKAAQLGLLGTSIPQQYGGFGMDFNTGLLVTEVLGAGHSFTVSIAAHTGIGTLPILYYGNEKQKATYLPKLATGEYKACYCLTEPDSGSDANSGKTKAVLSSDGKYYTINGQKMWITNGGFADIFIVFAKIADDKNLSAFIVEKSFGGITMNEEEKKMGIKGSSTRQVFFNDCKVPVENLLSERGNGFKIAVNILNIGRIKLASAAIGGAKATATHAIKYANERKQFGQSIGNFGAIQHKLAEQAVRIYASESSCYRAGQYIENSIEAYKANGLDEIQAKLKGVEQFAIECAIMKVHASETLDFVVDEGLQIFGGMGFSAEAPMERGYRDSRINRIFEGTNEINRLLSVDMILRRALKGELDLMGPAQAVVKELTAVPDLNSESDETPFSKEKKLIKNLKKALLMTAGAAVQKFMTALEKEQELLMDVADMLIEIYVCESTLLRTEKLIQQRGKEKSSVYIDMAMVYLVEAVDRISIAAKEAINSFSVGDEQKMLLMGLKRFTKMDPYNTKEARRRIAQYVIQKNEYPF